MPPHPPPPHPPPAPTGPPPTAAGAGYPCRRRACTCGARPSSSTHGSRAATPRRAAACASRTARLRVEDGADLLRELAGRRVAFLGDSTTRLLAYEAALWGWGCAVVWDIAPQPPAWPGRLEGVTLASAAFPGGQRFADQAQLCEGVGRFQRWEQADNVMVVPTGPAPSRRDVTLDWRWCRWVWECGDALLALLGERGAAAPDLVVFNVGFWHLRNTPQRHEVACEGDAWGLQCGLDSLLARLAALGGGARARLLWRGYSLLEMREGRYFHSDVVRAHDALAAAKWARAGYAVVPMAHLTPPRDGGDGNWTFTVDGYHPERYIYRQHLREVLQVGLGMMEVAGGVAAAGVAAGDEARAATAGQAMRQPASVGPVSVANSSEELSEGPSEGPFEHPPAAANPSESSALHTAPSALAFTDLPSASATTSSLDERAHTAPVAGADDRAPWSVR